jgi:hypothetical protein
MLSPSSLTRQTEASLSLVPFADLPNTSREQRTKTSLHREFSFYIYQRLLCSEFFKLPNRLLQFSPCINHHSQAKRNKTMPKPATGYLDITESPKYFPRHPKHTQPWGKGRTNVKQSHSAYRKNTQGTPTTFAFVEVYK